MRRQFESGNCDLPLYPQEVRDMSNVMMKTDLEGKIRNLRHFKSEALLPIFEAIINSIQAIEEAGDLRTLCITP